MLDRPAIRGEEFPMASLTVPAPASESLQVRPDLATQIGKSLAQPSGSEKPERSTSLDAYRGFIMLVMASAGFGLPEVAGRFPNEPVWQFLGYEFDHVTWAGCAFWDLIQPSFMFMVGVAMPYSFASRRAKGHGPWRNLGHVLWRSFVLIALAVFLSSNHEKRTSFVFPNVLAQIGLGYAFVYLFLGRGIKVQLAAIALILIGYWLFFFVYPTPGPDFDYAAVGVTKEAERFDGLFAHWNKNTNAAAAFDQKFLNVFPREKPFVFNEGGYQTLNFIPSMATMLFGLMAGEFLRSNRPGRTKLRWLLAAGAICLVAGWVLNQTVCPSVKRIWTPSWAIFSTGWTFYMLAAFYWVIDLEGYKRWAFPLVIVGMNSIAIYCMSQLMKPWIAQTLRTHFGQDIFAGTYGIIWQRVATLAVLWLICLWLYRRKIFIRI
jgi:predicted acyltransferase